jgi:hypothetical protein
MQSRHLLKVKGASKNQFWERCQCGWYAKWHVCRRKSGEN